MEPKILTANTYFWTPCMAASARRANEERKNSEVAEYFESIGMTVTNYPNHVYATLGEITALFQYQETCSCVKKTLCVTVAGNMSNVSAIRKLADPAKRPGFLRSATMRARKQNAAAVTAKLLGT